MFSTLFIGERLSPSSPRTCSLHVAASLDLGQPPNYLPLRFFKSGVEIPFFCTLSFLSTVTHTDEHVHIRPRPAPRSSCPVGVYKLCRRAPRNFFFFFMHPPPFFLFLPILPAKNLYISTKDFPKALTNCSRFQINAPFFLHEEPSLLGTRGPVISSISPPPNKWR